MGGMTPDVPGDQGVAKPTSSTSSLTSPSMVGPSPSPETSITSNTHHSTNAAPGRGFGGQGAMSGRAPTPQGNNHVLKLASPSAQGSPSITSGAQGAMMSPCHRQSPSTSSSSPHLHQNPSGAFSPAAGLHSPTSVCSSTGNGPGFSSNSLSALQALSQGQGVSQGVSQGLMEGRESPDRKPGSLQSPLHTSNTGSQLAKNNASSEDDLFGTFEEQQDLLSSQNLEDEQREGGDGGSESFGAPNRLLNSKSHTKLLQLLTNKSEHNEPCSPHGPLGDDQNCKDHMGGTGGVGGAGNTHSTSLKEKHKILHRLLQNSTSPVELAKLTAEATGKDSTGPESASGDNMAAMSELSMKQEPGSPKKKDNALLRYLLDRDDNIIQEKSIKVEPGEGLKLSNIKTEKQEAGFNMADQTSELEDLLEDLQNGGQQQQLFTGQQPARGAASSSASSSSAQPASSSDKQTIISDILQMTEVRGASSPPNQHRAFPAISPATGYFNGSRPGPPGRGAPPVRSTSLDSSMGLNPNATRPLPPQHRNNFSLLQQQQQQGMMGSHTGMNSQAAMANAGMLSGGSVRGSMPQSWGPQGPIPGTTGLMMGQGVGPSRMVPSMSSMRGGGQTGSRAMVNMQMIASEMEMANSAYPQQQAPPNQMAPWPDRMMTMDHYGNQSRPPYGVPEEGGVGCCGSGPEGPLDEGTLLNQLCSVLKDFEGLEEIDKMLGIPTLAGQGSLSDQDRYLGSSDPAASMKPPLYSQHYGGQYGSLPPDAGFHSSAVAGQMGPQRMAAGYPPMMRMSGGAGPRPNVMRPGGPNLVVPPQPNNLRLQLQHRLQAQLGQEERGMSTERHRKDKLGSASFQENKTHRDF
ncbi:hypothetical protein LDENG_00158640 [Lucifuga dentata]|nr:hypothetical protein LDENG_00158640 [Lucifuga dentata]